jgi:hypothetical protein
VNEVCDCRNHSYFDIFYQVTIAEAKSGGGVRWDHTPSVVGITAHLPFTVLLHYSNFHYER